MFSGENLHCWEVDQITTVQQPQMLMLDFLNGYSNLILTMKRSSIAAWLCEYKTWLFFM